MDDRSIFLAIARFDKTLESEAIKTIYRQVSKPVKNFVVTNSGTSEEAEDILQDAIIIFLNKVRLKELQQLTSKISTYIFAVARNNWLYTLRKKGRMPISELKIISDDPSNLDEDSAIYTQVLGKLMDLIKEPCKSIITTFYLDRLSIKQMAEKFGYKDENGMKKKKSLCMKTAREMANDLLTIEYEL